MCIIVYFVLFSDKLGRDTGYDTFQYNLTPLKEIRRFITYRDSVPMWAFILNLVGNLLIFAPLGFLVPLMRTGKTGVIRIFVYSLLFSLGIEILQLVTRVGVFDIDDIILNTAGGLIGYGLYLFTRFLYRRQLAWLKGHEGQ